MGALTVWRKEAGSFSTEVVNLLQTFATQSALAIQNARLFREIEDKSRQIEAANRHKSEFLANMSHELRTPLNAIIGFSEVLKDGMLGALTDQQRGFIGDIFSSGTHLLSLINDILDLSKVEAGKMMLDLEAVDVRAMLENSLSIIREKAALRHVRLTMNAGEELGVVDVDARKLKQVVYNLLSNAVKFTGDGGVVTLNARHVPLAEVGRISEARAGRNFPLVSEAFGEFLEISVEDSGIGIAPEGLDRLFKPFSQVDSGLARKFEGTGLGLVMVKLLAELHGGTVAVESTVNEGSRFTVWLPVRTSAVRRSAPNGVPVVRADAPAPGTRTALVVEDDDKAAELIRLQLEADGFLVLHVRSAEEALAVAVTQPLALITLDIMLPDMDGWDLLARIKKMPSLGSVPVVIISIVADRHKGFALGAAAVLQKPVSREELYASLVETRLFPRTEDQTLRVLIVDDDTVAAGLIAERIGDMASTVLRASGGKEGIEMARRELPDLMILELMMPEVSGFDVVAALSQHPDTAGIPILVITAARLTRAERERLNGFVTAVMENNVFDEGRLAAEVRRAMSGRLQNA
jgi:signal transduction histidine kinase/DNA-binding response OmpR family regulator